MKKLLLIFSLFVLVSFLPSVQGLNESFVLQSYGIINYPIHPPIEEGGQIFRGTMVRFHEATGVWMGSVSGNGFDHTEYERFSSWGLNSIGYFLYWTGQIELDEMQPSVYYEEALVRLGQQVDLAKEYGLYPFIVIRSGYDPLMDQPWFGWSNQYGDDYYNLNTVDASGTGGRDRYVTFLKMLATRFPDLGISITFFPYHRQGNIVDDARIQALYEVTIPHLYDEVRAVTDEYIYFEPLFQSQSGGWSTGLTTGQYSIIEQYGYPFTDDYKLVYGFNNHGKDSNDRVTSGVSAWDYDYDRIDQHLAPLVAFKQKYNISALCMEGFALDIHLSHPERPIVQSRLDWVEAQMQKADEEGLGWFWFMYENPPSWASPIEDDGSENAVAELIKGYAGK